MIDGCIINGVEIPFHSKSSASRKNIYTTIVGRNGSGKSRMLRGIINSFIPRELHDDAEQLPIVVNNSFFQGAPNKIIAVSTSPFDKFPYDNYLFSDHYNGARAGYSYLGLKGISTENFGLGYLSRIMGALMRAMSSDPSNALTVASTLSYLEYSQEVEAEFQLVPKIGSIRKILSSADPRSAIEEIFRGGGGFKFRNAFKNKRVKDAIINVVYNSLVDFESKHSKSNVRILLSGNGVVDASTRAPLGNYFYHLHEVGLIRLSDLVLEKHNKKIRIKDASSGEQCVVMTMLGIASQIEDGSLICIDEPEVCLHPEWQERYIEFLMEMFNRFEHCHFIIATHSPQIVAKLGSDNCYVLDLEQNELSSARTLNKRSADYQLAKVFHTPGFKNEYLSRELLSALGTLGGGGKLNDERRASLADAIALKSKLESDDPVLQLILLLEGALAKVEVR